MEAFRKVNFVHVYTLPVCAETKQVDDLPGNVDPQTMETIQRPCIVRDLWVFEDRIYQSEKEARNSSAESNTSTRPAALRALSDW